MAPPQRAATKALGRPVHAKRLSEVEKLRAEMLLQQHLNDEKTHNDHLADRARTKLGKMAGMYAELLDQLGLAVGFACQDYTDVLNMKDRPEIGEVIFETAMAGLAVVVPELKAMKEAVELAKTYAESTVKISVNVGKLFDGKADPNVGAKMRILAARNFMAEIDTARAQIRRAVSDGYDIIDAWSAKPDGNVNVKVRQRMRTLKIKYDAPPL